MPGKEIAEYGMSFFAVAIIAWIAYQVITNNNAKKAAECQSTPAAPKVTCAEHLSEVISNNTKAINELTTVIKVNLATQDTKIDEILVRARAQK